jgi:hypothetical protein
MKIRARACHSDGKHAYTIWGMNAASGAERMEKIQVPE